MKLPFLRFFKKAEAAEPAVVATGSRPVVTVEKPAAERYAKTFTPNATRQVVVEAPRAYAPAGVGAATIAPLVPAVLPSLSPTISLSASTLVPPPPRSISLGDGPRIRMQEPEASTAITERAISLQLSEINLPEGILHSVGLDPERRLLFKAADLERGMSSGKPSVKLRSIYQQAPEFFTHEIGAEDPAEVTLPFSKVLEQFANFQVRSDQIIEETLPQVETPFLQVTLEDNERFGTSTAGTPVAAPVPLPSLEIPEQAHAAPADTDAPIRLTVPKEAAPAAAREPIRLSPTTSTAPVDPVASTAPVAPVPSVAPKISPNGTGVPATERVPASSGSPVPTPFPSPLAPASASPNSPAPARIPLKITPPSNDLRESPALKSAGLKPEVAKVEFCGSGPRIRLTLRSILRGVAPCQLSGPTETVPEDAVIELPFAIIQPQLSLGKVSISPAQFHAALPDKYRDTFTIEDQATPISLPLQEVLQNLPNESLTIRGDQETVEILPNFETPFSLKAAEDAVRLKAPEAEVGTTAKNPSTSTASIKPAAEKSGEPKALETKSPPPISPSRVAPVAPTAAPATVAAPATPGRLVATPPVTAPATAAFPVPMAAPQPIVAPTAAATPIRVAAPPPVVAAAAAVPTTKPARDPLQLVFDTDETMDAKNVVAHISRLPGVRACALFFSDGLSLAGNMPSEFKIDPLCAIAPGLVRKCQEQMASSNLGTFAGLTLSCTKSAVTFFAHGDVCLAALHWAGREIEIATRTQLSSVTAELARTYAPTKKVSA
jgi:predicted regulator of Ras-like GTPase activity (Roadblock/LC7/MglB family)